MLPVACAPSELFREAVRVLRALQPFHVAPDKPAFVNAAGEPIEPKSFSEHWYKALRALELRVRGLYRTKDTHVSHALQTLGDPLWVEKQTGVAYTTLRRLSASRWQDRHGRWTMRTSQDARRVT